MAYTTAENAAKWFLARNRADYKMGYTDEPVTNLKLQKLLYYAQGCVLALTDKPLFDEEIEAWEHGPVVSEIYHEYKIYDKLEIEFDEPFDENLIDRDVQNILESVYDEFGQYSAWKLRDMTHNETPWQNTLKNSVIKIDEIKNISRSIILKMNKTIMNYLVYTNVYMLLVTVYYTLMLQKEGILCCVE